MGPPLTAEEVEFIRLVALFCEQKGFAQTGWALERESGISTREHGSEILFARELLLEGCFRELREFLEPLVATLPNEQRNHFLFEVGKQEFLELLARHRPTQQVDDLVQVLRPLEALCSAAEFHQLCFCLTVPSLTEHPDLAGWSVHVGRLRCFQALEPTLALLFPGQVAGPVPPSSHALLAGVLTGNVRLAHTLRDGDDRGPANATRAGGLGTSPHRHTPPAPPAPDPARPPAGQADLAAHADFAADAATPAPPSLTPRPRSAAPSLTVAVPVLRPGCPTRTASFSPDGRHFLVGTNDQALHICTVPDALFEQPDHYVPTDGAVAPCVDVVHTCHEHHAGSIYCAAWSPDGALIASGSNDKRIRVVRFDAMFAAGLNGGGGGEVAAEEADIVAPFASFRQTGTVRDVCFGAGGATRHKLLSVGAGDCSVWVWDLLALPTASSPSAELHGHADAVWSVRVDAGTGNLAATASQDGAVKVWDLRTGFVAHDVAYSPADPRGAGGARCADFVPGGASGTLDVLTAHSNGDVVGWDLRRPDVPVVVLCRHDNDCRTVEVCPSDDGSCAFVTASFDRTAHVGQIDPACPLELVSLDTLQHDGRVLQARWHPTHHAVLTCTADSVVAIWAGGGGEDVSPPSRPF